jgi:LacI family transcriptional regulator
MVSDVRVGTAEAAQGGRPTLKTIAYMTGLGVTTVSRALNDAPDIGQATKERVRLVAKQIGYRPNRAGVRLRTGKTNVISLVLSVENEVLGLTSHVVYGISEYLASTPYHLIVTPYRLGGDPLDPVRYIV